MANGVAMVADLLQRWADYRAWRRTSREARHLVREARRILRKYAWRVPEEAAREVGGAAEGVIEALRARDTERVKGRLARLDEQIDRHLAFARKSAAREYAESIGWALAVALLLRAFCVEAFKIPSGSMLPTLEVGDHIFVNKFVYGLQVPFRARKFNHFRDPRRGEVVVFIYPREEDKDFIKRIVALGGDTVELRDDRLIVNGEAVPRRRVDGTCRYQDRDEFSGRWAESECQAWEEELGGYRYRTVLSARGSSRPNFGPRRVEPGHVFVMGDNRDNSHDSRFWGTVPIDHIKGKAMFIWLSWGPDGVRWRRFFDGVHGDPDPE